MRCPIIDDRPFRYSVVSYRYKKMIVFGYFHERFQAENYAARLSADFPHRVFQVLDCLF